jgi:Glycerophosphoryl diester phosphodiesterase
MHDDTLERTTNVAEVFPDRVSTNYQTRQPGKHWVGNDFTMAELKRLDSGKWFKPEFAGQRLLSFQEMIDLVKARPGFGIYPELKSPELYKSRGVDQEKLFVDLVKKNGLEKPESLKTFPVIIQSFDESAIRRVASICRRSRASSSPRGTRTSPRRASRSWRRSPPASRRRSS